MLQLSDLIIYIFLFFLGSIFGSFAYLVVRRRIREESIIRPASHCEFCGHRLGVVDLFPILSFLFLKGRCRYCGHKLSKEYMVFEIFGGLLMIFSFFPDLDIKGFFIFASLLLGLIISVIDLKTLEVYSFHLYILIGLGIIYRFIFLSYDWKFFVFLIIFSLIYFLIYILSKKGLGDGDYFFYLAWFFFVEDRNLLEFLLFSLWLGGLHAIYLAIKRKSIKGEMAFCIHIYLAFILQSLLFKFGVLL